MRPGGQSLSHGAGFTVELSHVTLGLVCLCHHQGVHAARLVLGFDLDGHMALTNPGWTLQRYEST